MGRFNVQKFEASPFGLRPQKQGSKVLKGNPPGGQVSNVEKRTLIRTELRELRIELKSTGAMIIALRSVLSPYHFFIVLEF
jgi:hypothetical protein